MSKLVARGSQLEAVIGIETHVQLATKSKLFCGCDNNARGKAPNTTVCPVCLGMPGTLPVLNEAAVRLAIRAGLALNGKIADRTKFDRKNYFYPDLPKGYQITQYDQPIVGAGRVEFQFEGKTSRVGIIRAHLEEDAGKLTHPAGADHSLLDLNRAGTPLLEVVSAPDITSPAQAKAYAQEVYHLMRYAGVSDADLYYGNMRFDVNVSLRPAETKDLGTRTEIKNLNSFRAVERAAEYEIKRQTEALERGDQIIQETRGWDETTGKTFAQRSKEEAHDYRYFPEPDLPPLVITPAQIKAAGQDLTTPQQVRAQLTQAGVGPAEAEILVGSFDLQAIYREITSRLPATQLKNVINWLVGPVQASLADVAYDQTQARLHATMLITLAEQVESGELSQSGAKEVIAEVMRREILTPQNLQAALAQRRQVSGQTELLKLIEQVLSAHPQAVADYHAGKQRALGALMGQVMQASAGRANPQKVREMLVKELGNEKKE